MLILILALLVNQKEKVMSGKLWFAICYLGSIAVLAIIVPFLPFTLQKWICL